MHWRHTALARERARVRIYPIERGDLCIKVHLIALLERPWALRTTVDRALI
jgi:hypothetical protein